MIKNSRRGRQVKLVLPPALYEQIAAQASSEGLSVATYLRCLIIKQLPRQAKNAKISPAKPKSASPPWRRVQAVFD